MMMIMARNRFLSPQFTPSTDLPRVRTADLVRGMLIVGPGRVPMRIVLVHANRKGQRAVVTYTVPFTRLAAVRSNVTAYWGDDTTWPVLGQLDYEAL